MDFSRSTNSKCWSQTPHSRGLCRERIRQYYNSPERQHQTRGNNLSCDGNHRCDVYRSSSSSSSSSNSKRMVTMLCRSNMVHVRADAGFTRENGDGSISHVVAYFHTSPQLVADSHPLDTSAILADIVKQIERWNGRGSGFVLDRVLRFVLCIDRFRKARTFRNRNGWIEKMCRQRAKPRPEVLSLDRALCSAPGNRPPLSSFKI